MKHRAAKGCASCVILSACITAAQGQSTINNRLMSDYNGDSVVDAADYSVWRNSFGDFNQDHTIDARDYALWRQNYGSTGGTSENHFNGSTLGLPVPMDALLAWRSVPLIAMFDTKSAYNGWVNRLTTAATLPGDYNGDSVVDAADYTVWRDALLTTTTVNKFLTATGDTNADGDVDARDYLVWRDNLGATTNLNTPTPLPAGDFNSDGVVDAADYTVWRDGLGGAALLSSGAAVTINAGNDWAWFIDPATVYNPGLVGDLNHDGFVGIGDLDIVLGNWNKNTPPADFAADPTGDGFVGIGDLDTVLGNWNAGTPPGANTNIPEPGTGVSIMMCAWGVLRRRGT